MPGVPSGRACEGCRKQKKKCDEKQPACSRCIRLKLPCIGSGQQRFKFQADKRTPKNIKQAQSVARREPRSAALQQSQSQTQNQDQDQFPLRLASGSPIPIPTNKLSQLTSAFTRSIQRSTDLRFNLCWNFGSFLEDVPRRLGANEALDRAVDAVTTAHAGFCAGHVASVEALTKYSHALRTLRVYLDDRVHAQSSNTLCAVMVLLVCQMFIGPTMRCWSGHAEGAAQILKARRRFSPQDPFEQKLFLSLRGSVLFEGLFNHRIHLTPEEWSELVTNKLDGGTSEGRILLYLARGPDLMRRGRETLKTGEDSTGVQDEIWGVYQSCKLILSTMKLRLDEKEAAIAEESAPSRQEAEMRQFLFTHYQRTYGIGLGITLIFNCMLGALGAHDAMTIFDGTWLAEETLLLAERSMVYRPVGCGYLLFCLSAAWAAVADSSLRDRLMGYLRMMNDDFKIRDCGSLPQELEVVAEHMRLGTPYRLRSERMASERLQVVT